MKKNKKRAFTLLEIMIVIFLIGLIGSVIGYNMKGSLEKGKVFKTEQGAAQLRDVLLLQVADGASLDDVVGSPLKYVKKSGLIRDPDKAVKDGWGQPYVFEKDDEEILKVTSQALIDYNARQKKIK